MPKINREKRDQRLVIVFTLTDRKALERVAGHEPVTSWIRRQAMAALARAQRKAGK